MTGARTPPSRVSQARILADLKLAAKKGDRSALSLALDRMRTLAHSPRYWEKYVGLLRNPLARQQKGWKLPRPAPADAARTKKRRKAAAASRRKPVATAEQPSLFDL